MAIWNRGQPAAGMIRADAGRSAQVDEHVAGQIGADDPGLVLAIVKSGTVVHAAGYRPRSPAVACDRYACAACGDTPFVFAGGSDAAASVAASSP